MFGLSSFFRAAAAPVFRRAVCYRAVRLGRQVHSGRSGRCVVGRAFLDPTNWETRHDRQSQDVLIACSAQARPSVQPPAVSGLLWPRCRKPPGFYLGPVGDFGWTYQHDLGRKEVVEKIRLQDRLDLCRKTFRKSADAERVISALAHKGYESDLHDLVRLHESDLEGR